MCREQHRIRVVLVRTGDFDKDVGSFEVCAYPGAGGVHDSRIEVIDNLNIRVDRFDS